MLNGLRTNCYKVTMLFQRQGDKKSVWICPAHPHTIYAFITKELRLKRLLVKFQNNFFRHFTRIARRTHIGNSRSGQTGQVFFSTLQFREPNLTCWGFIFSCIYIPHVLVLARGYPPNLRAWLCPDNCTSPRR